MIEMNIGNKTGLYCIIGMPAHHSLSPDIQNAMFKALHMDAAFFAFDVPAEMLEAAVKGMKAYGIIGMTLTSPHKEAVMKYVDSIDNDAKKLGAVNTLVIRNGKFYGYNTDHPGFVESLKKFKSSFNVDYSIIGAGGAARACAYGVLRSKMANKITIINRTIKHAEELKAILKSDFKNADIRTLKLGTVDADKAVENSGVVVNATNITLENKRNTPVKKNSLHKGQIVFDANYVPINNKLLSDAKAKGCITINGLELLVNQGVVAFELFTGKKADYKIMKKAAMDSIRMSNH
jgi:shikimate dehydrogenase